MAPPDPARQRDLRLDAFRGLAMMIILLAHTPGNIWTLWIPARFGFSDATEMFVFCSGLASALAFGRIFQRSGWWLGTVRIIHRIWQVYWSQTGLVLVTILVLLLIDRSGWGLAGKVYVNEIPVQPLFERTGEALVGLFTLTWIPNYFDILPMYIVLLAMIPAVLLVHRVAGPWAVAGLLLALWGAAQAGLAQLSARPWDAGVGWFFNPFAWQLVFFTGFAFGARWLPAPPVARWLVWLAAGYVVAVVPFAWYQIHEGFIIPADWALRHWIVEVRAATEPLWRKTDLGVLRYLHFLAVAYLAWVLVGPAGARLRTGWTAPVHAPRPGRIALCALVLALTLPYSWSDEIALLSPGLDRALIQAIEGTATSALGLDIRIDPDRIGIVQIVHLAALIALVWAGIGPRGRDAVLGRYLVGTVNILSRVGSQSLAVFLVSIVLAQVNGWILDLTGRTMWTWWAVNLWGFGALVGVAMGAAWIKGQPWTRPRAEPVGAGRAAGFAPTAAE